MVHALFVLGVLILFIGMWCYVCFTISKHGWSDFARLYRVNQPPQGKVYWGQSGAFNRQGSYARIINVVIAQEGIGLSIWLPWRCGHPPILVPWVNLIKVEERGLFFLIKYLRVTLVGGERTFQLRLPLWTKKELLKYKPDPLIYTTR